MTSESFIGGIEPVDLESFENEGYSEQDALDLAQGLLLVAIPCLETIYEKFSVIQKKTIRFAVLEMAKYIKVDFDNFDRATSPFQSETIGSYSYSKMAASIRSGSATGVPAFDRAVEQFASMCDLGGLDGGTYVSSEMVFKPGFDRYLQEKEAYAYDVPPFKYPGGGC